MSTRVRATWQPVRFSVTAATMLASRTVAHVCDTVTVKGVLTGLAEVSCDGSDEAETVATSVDLANACGSIPGVLSDTNDCIMYAHIEYVPAASVPPNVAVPVRFPATGRPA